MIEFFTVDVVSISSSQPRSSFDAVAIENLADDILASGGLVRPLVLKPSGIEEYSVISGDLEYYAAVRAREKDPRQAEMVNAFVVNLKQEAKITQQLAHLDANFSPSDRPTSAQKTSQPTTEIASKAPDPAWISSFENRLAELRELVFQSQRESDVRLTTIERQFERETYTSLLDLINRQAGVKLANDLQRYGLDAKKAAAIVQVRSKQKTKTFESYAELLERTPGFGNAALLKVIDLWERVNLSDLGL